MESTAAIWLLPGLDRRVFVCPESGLTIEIPFVEPVSFTGGDIVQWYRLDPDFLPTDGFTYKARIVGDPLIASGTPYTAVVDFTGMPLFTIPAADTAQIVSDTVQRLFCWVDDGNGNIYQIYDDYVAIFANVRTATLDDLKTKAERELELLDIAIADRLTGEGIISYSIDGRSVTLETLEQAYALRAAISVRIAKERGVRPPAHGVRFRVAR